MAHYLVTGGAGFIGSHLVAALLARGARVRVLDDLSSGRREVLPPEVELLVGDIRDPTTVERAMSGVEGCFHLAAVASVQRSIQDWVGTHGVNLTGAIQVFEAARREGPIPVVYASSASIYGNNHHCPLSEEELPSPLSAYGADKLGCEFHARVGGEVYGLPTMGFRFFNVFGPGQDPNSPYSGVISIFIHRALRGEALTIFGDGQQVRDFVYVADVVQFLLAGMTQADRRGQVFNVCSGQPTTIRALAEEVVRLAGTQSTITHLPARDGDIRISIGNPDKGAIHLGLRAETAFATGLQRTMQG